MTRVRLILPVLLLAVCACTPGEPVVTEGGNAGAAIPAGALHNGPAFQFNEVADGVYHIVGTGALSVGANSVAIVNDEDVMLVDSHISPAALYVLQQEITAVTDKPIRYVVNTHYHFDHVDGNQMFGEGIEIIGHRFTRDKLEGDPLSERTYANFTSGLPAQIAQLEADIAASPEADRAALEEQLFVTENFSDALGEVVPTPPNLVLDRKMTIFSGDREIQLLFLGRAHTGGDVLVYLPAERILCTGDVLVEGLAFMGDGYIGDWIDTLDALAELDFDTVLPGHGAAFTGKEKIDQFKSYLADLWTQANQLHSRGVPAGDAAAMIDLTVHSGAFPQIQGVGADALAVQRIYELLDGAE
jgi:glyoxylase-like metal-dependent hydrolase (beta-lactamase superfamily II)